MISEAIDMNLIIFSLFLDVNIIINYNYRNKVIDNEWQKYNNQIFIEVDKMKDVM